MSEFLSNLVKAKNLKKKKRLGRGDASGHGGTSTKGHKGQKARSGGYHRLGFEGGQMPLIRRIPKRGFFNPEKKEFSVVNLESLNDFEAGQVIDPKLLKEKGLVRNIKLPVKILGNGDFKNKLTIKAQAFSATALEKIKKSGSSAELIK